MEPFFFFLNETVSYDCEKKKKLPLISLYSQKHAPKVNTHTHIRIHSEEVYKLNTTWSQRPGSTVLDNYTCWGDRDLLLACACVRKGVCVSAVFKLSQLVRLRNIQPSITLILHHWNNEAHSNSLMYSHQARTFMMKEDIKNLMESFQ